MATSFDISQLENIEEKIRTHDSVWISEGNRIDSSVNNVCSDGVKLLNPIVVNGVITYPSASNAFVIKLTSSQVLITSIDNENRAIGEIVLDPYLVDNIQ